MGRYIFDCYTSDKACMYEEMMTNNDNVESSIGRSRGVCQHTPPLQDPILSFLHTFSLKSAHVGGQNPPKMGPCPPMENPGSGPV